MPEESPNLERLAEFIRLVETYDLAELVVEEGDCRYAIRGGRSVAAPGGGTPQPNSTPEAAQAPGSQHDDRIAVTSPMVGVFFRAPSPNERPFVEVGDPVEEGQTIGIIEAMKVFSEVPCPASGVVDEIAVSDSELVKAGQVLLYLRPMRPEEEDAVEHD